MNLRGSERFFPGSEVMSTIMVNTQNIHELSKSDACISLEFICECLKCEDLEHFRQLFALLGKIIPFEMATGLISKKNEQGGIDSVDIINVSYPAEWVELYIKNNYHLVDPVLQANFRDFSLQYWSDTYRKTPPPKKFLSTAEDFRLRDGYTQGVKSFSGEEGSLFSFAGASLERSVRTETILNVIVPHLHQAFCRAVNYSKSRYCDALSPREKEILSWMKQGKSTWDISSILGISERTVHFHVHNVIRKLNASSRAHAVAIAMEGKIIAPS